MKKTLLFLIVVSVCLKMHGQGEITQELEEFTTIKGFDGLSINLIKSDTNKAIITGANTNKVAIVNTNGVLKLRMKINKIFFIS